MSHQRPFTGVQEEEEGWLLEAEFFSVSLCHCISLNTAKSKRPDPDSQCHYWVQEKSWACNAKESIS